MSVGSRINSLLARMSVMAEGKTASWSPSVTGGDRDFSPRSQGDSLSDTWGTLFTRLADLAEVEIEQASGSAGFRATPREDRERRNARILLFEGRHSLFVAYVVNLSEDTVRQVRQKAGVSPIDGRKSPQNAG